MQARNAFIDVKVANKRSLIPDLKEPREKSPQIVQESCLVADAMKIPSEFPLHVKARELYSL